MIRRPKSKNNGHPGPQNQNHKNLRRIGDSPLCPKERLLRRVDRADCPQFVAPCTQPAFSFTSLPDRLAQDTRACRGAAQTSSTTTGFVARASRRAASTFVFVGRRHALPQSGAGFNRRFQSRDQRESICAQWGSFPTCPPATFSRVSTCLQNRDHRNRSHPGRKHRPQPLRRQQNHRDASSPGNHILQPIVLILMHHMLVVNQ